MKIVIEVTNLKDKTVLNNVMQQLMSCSDSVTYRSVGNESFNSAPSYNGRYILNETPELTQI